MFKKLIANFGVDKLYHFAACFIITFIVGVVMIPVTNLFGVMFSSFMCGSAAALAKEYADKVNPNNKWDWKDIVADYCGIGLALIILIVLYVVI